MGPIRGCLTWRSYRYEGWWTGSRKLEAPRKHRWLVFQERFVMQRIDDWLQRCKRTPRSQQGNFEVSWKSLEHSLQRQQFRDIWTSMVFIGGGGGVQDTSLCWNWAQSTTIELFCQNKLTLDKPQVSSWFSPEWWVEDSWFWREVRPTVWRRKGAAFDDKNIVYMLKHVCGSIMMLVYFCSKGTGEIVIAKGRMKSSQYQDILEVLGASSFLEPVHLPSYRWLRFVKQLRKGPISEFQFFSGFHNPVAQILAQPRGFHHLLSLSSGSGSRSRSWKSRKLSPRLMQPEEGLVFCADSPLCNLQWF